MAFTIWQNHPLIGVGLSNFRDHALSLGLDKDLMVPLGYEGFHAHNTYLEILVDSGIIGLASYLFFLTMTARGLLRYWRLLRSEGRSQTSTFVVAAIGTLAAYAVFATVDMLLIQNTHMLVVLILSLALMSGAAAQRAASLTDSANQGISV